jgi:polysaccharide biosynthesis/export protein
MKWPKIYAGRSCRLRGILFAESNSLSMSYLNYPGSQQKLESSEPLAAILFSSFRKSWNRIRRDRISSWIQGLVAVVVLGLSGCQTTISTSLPQKSMAGEPVVLTAGDVVKVSFPGEPDFSQSQKIQTDGKINLPLVGQVTAAGRTIASLQSTLEALYHDQLQNPAVVVTLDSSVTPVILAGAIRKPAKYLFDRPTTIFQAVMEAGGPDEFGTFAKVNLIRVVGGQQRTEVFDLRPIVQGRAVRPIYVQAGDVIVVGDSKF